MRTYSPCQGTGESAQIAMYPYTEPPKQSAPGPLDQCKVMIPRLPRQVHVQTKHRVRVRRACTACRLHRIKCTGQQPRCQPCNKMHRECIYVDDKKNKLEMMQERCQRLSNLLQQLQQNANGDDEVRIAKVLRGIQEEDLKSSRVSWLQNHATDAQDSQSQDIRSVAYRQEHEMYSAFLQDAELPADHSSVAYSLLGNSSETHWLQAVAATQSEQMEYLDNDEGEKVTSFQRNSASSWKNDEHVDAEAHTDPYALPSLVTAELLLACYTDKVHTLFPILSDKVIKYQVRGLFADMQEGTMPRLSSKWQAILILVFALGAKYLHLMGTDCEMEGNNHLVFQARAQSLSLTTAVDHADVVHVQGLGLFAFYWLSTGQIERAWSALGAAIRSAHALGLHLSKQSTAIPVYEEQETLVNVWWSLYSLEQILSITTGRPSSIQLSHCSVPLPRLATEQQHLGESEGPNQMHKIARNPQSNDSVTLTLTSNKIDTHNRAYFESTVRLSIIINSISTSLYSVSSMIKSQVEIERDMTLLSQRLDYWSTSLSDELSSWSPPITSSAASRCRETSHLAFQYYSARILLGVPFLGAVLQSRDGGNEADSVAKTANGCVEAAKMMINLLSDGISTRLICDKAPWWCITHYLTQAVSVFLVRLSHPSPVSQENAALVPFLVRATRWMQTMQDTAADRAYQLVMRLFANVARRYSIDMSILQSSQQ